MITNPLVINALIAVMLMSVASGFTGTYIVIRRISGLSGGISHAVLGGIGIAVYAGIHPLLGALAAALVVALLIAVITLYYRQQEDTLINAIWAIGMAVGVIFLSLTPGSQKNMVNFLFGNIFYIEKWNLGLLLGLDVFIILFYFLFFRQLVYVSFDEEYSRIRGIRSDLISVIQLILVSLTVVVLINAVGLILIIALLSLPPAIARNFQKSTGPIIFLSVGISLLISVGGLLISFPLGLPSASVIIVCLGVVYLVTLPFRSRRFRQKLKSSVV